MSNESNIHDRNPALADVLKSLSEAKLRDVIYQLASKDPAVAAALEHVLFIYPDEIPGTPPRKRKADEMSPNGQGKADPKRPTLARYRTCKNCEQTFDVTDNDPESCVYHLEESEVDYEGDFWADHDPDCHGDPEDLRDEYPEGFVYPCCDKNGKDAGCQTGKHEEEEV